MDKNTVPARIVIVGTSTMKLAERFKRLEAEMATRKPRTFLYDEYMDNTMYADEITQRERRPVRDYTDLDRYEDEEMDEMVVPAPRGRGTMMRSDRMPDPIFGADGAVFASPRSQGGRRPISTRVVSGGARRQHPAYALLDEPRKRIVQQRPRMRQEVVEYVTERAPARRPVATRVIRRVVPRPQTITRRIVKRPAFKKTTRDADPNQVLGKPRKNQNPRAKMGAEDLDAELDAYMKSSKHPRVQA